MYIYIKREAYIYIYVYIYFFSPHINIETNAAYEMRSFLVTQIAVQRWALCPAANPNESSLSKGGQRPQGKPRGGPSKAWWPAKRRRLRPRGEPPVASPKPSSATRGHDTALNTAARCCHPACPTSHLSCRRQSHRYPVRPACFVVPVIAALWQ